MILTITNLFTILQFIAKLFLLLQKCIIVYLQIHLHTLQFCISHTCRLINIHNKLVCYSFGSTLRNIFVWEYIAQMINTCTYILSILELYKPFLEVRFLKKILYNKFVFVLNPSCIFICLRIVFLERKKRQMLKSHSTFILKLSLIVYRVTKQNISKNK